MRRRSLTISRKAATIVVVCHVYTDKSIVLQTFWNEEEGFMSETTVTDVKTGGRSGKGSVPLTVSVVNFDPSLGCDSATFQPCSDRALSTLKVIGDAFKELYPISRGLPSDQSGALFGFFIEEELLGGHVR
jgi:glucoamylase